jgi:hypothetical protein
MSQAVLFSPILCTIAMRRSQVGINRLRDRSDRSGVIAAGLIAFRVGPVPSFIPLGFLARVHDSSYGVLVRGNWKEADHARIAPSF